MMTLYGVELLRHIYEAYLERYLKSLQRGYDTNGNRYYWLYSELLIRVQTLREAMLYLDALPRFLDTAEDDKVLQCVFEYTSRLFSPENIGTSDRAEGEDHPFFHNGNPYWRELQEGMDIFNDSEILKNRPLLYVYACELIIRALRLYLQIRERKYHAIDREKFNDLMHMPKATLPGTA